MLKSKKTLVLLIRPCWVMASLFLMVHPSLAQEVKFPTPSYEGEELVKVREWEKTWVGKKVTTANVDQVKDLLTGPVYTIMKNPKNFGAADEIWFEVVPYREYKVSKGLIESTRKYAPQAKFDENMALLNYGAVAGIPFPQPDLSDPVLAGTQMAWNFDGFTHGDSSYRYAKPNPIVDPRTGLERMAGMHRWEMYWAARTDVPPKPEFPKNRRGIHRTFIQRHSDPPDFADTGVLEVKYKDTARAPDLWIYTAMFRRVRRYSTSQRSDMIDGTDLIYDDNNGWYTNINLNTYKFVGQKDLLLWRHQDDPHNKLTRITGQCFWNGVQRERVKCWVVEAVNKDPNYLYSKRIWYLDPENWQMNAQVMYDQQGRPWKLMEFGYEEFPGYGGELVSQNNSEHWVDLIRRHGSMGQIKIISVGKDFPKLKFSIAALQQQTY